MATTLMGAKQVILTGKGACKADADQKPGSTRTFNKVPKEESSLEFP